MTKYYVNKNKQDNGDNEVHTETCNYLPTILNRVYLGSFDTCTSAVSEAKRQGYKANGCYYCSRPCHTS